MINIKIFPFFIALIIFNYGCGSVKTVSYNEINSTVKITGVLGYPLGEIITIEGIGITDNSMRQRADKMLLKVERVNGVQLAKPAIIEYGTISFSEAGLPLEGKKFKYIGYETGGMTGIPYAAFKHIPFATTTDFSFGVSFILLKKLD